MDLPIEMQYQILLESSFYDILNYGIVNKLAAELCQSFSFWNKKAKQDFIHSLKDISGKTNAHKYWIVKNIYRSNQPLINSYILYDQPHLFKTLNRSESLQLRLLDLEINKKLMYNPQYLKELNKWNDSLSEVLSTCVYNQAILLKEFKMAKSISLQVPINFRDVAIHLTNDNCQWDMLKFLNDEAQKFEVYGILRDETTDILDRLRDYGMLEEDNVMEILKYGLDETYTREEIRIEVIQSRNDKDILFHFLWEHYQDLFY
jgi:hypothetical protein